MGLGGVPAPQGDSVVLEVDEAYYETTAPLNPGRAPGFPLPIRDALSVDGPRAKSGLTSVLVHFEPALKRGAPERAGVRAFAEQRGGILKHEYGAVLPNVVNLRDIPVEAVGTLEKLPGVVKVEKDEYHPDALALHDSTPLIRALQSQITAAGHSADGTGVRICIVDTGIDSDHAMYADRIDTSKGYDFYNDDANPEDDHGHGSHCAGIAAGGTGLSWDPCGTGSMPFQGVAPKATLIGCKVLNSQGGGYDSDIIAGINYCADQSASGAQADVISMSIGTGQYSGPCTHSWAVAANNAVANGVVAVAASGNENYSNALSSPACGANVIAVGMTWKNDYPTCEDPTTNWNWGICTDYAPQTDDVGCFSNESDYLDVTAPGANIWSASISAGGTSITGMSGTSMSCPHVAGLAALILDADPSLTPAEVRTIIRDGAIDYGPTGFDRAYGYGRIDAINSLALLGPQCEYDWECDDSNACTDDACVGGSCQYANNTDPCDDGLWCTITDACSGGACVGTGDRCPGQYCNEATDTCEDVECIYDEDCDDGNDCTVDTCTAGVCYNECPGNVSSYPYAEGWETGFGDWVNVTGDDMNWTRRSGSTPSSSTGPSSAHSGSYYVYTEASSPNYPNKTAILEGPCFDLSGASGADMTFWYHMYGTAMGTLNVEISDDCITWTVVWSLSGNQGSAWYQASVDLTAYAGSTIVIRFRGVTGSSYRSDMAVDDISLTVTGGPECTVPADCDDGLWCNGAEDCVDGSCVFGAAVDCNDGVGCTDDTCNEGTDSCDNVANDANCDNGLYCDGAEWCDPDFDCQSGTAVDCADALGCTVDSCNEGTDSCDNVPDNGYCDDGAFCNGAETCDPALDCQPGTDPCVGFFGCDEVNDVCVECFDNTDCDDGLWCNGAETCNVLGVCQAGTAVDCSDGIGCTDDSCNEVTDSCDNVANDANCNDGQYCNGDEWCDPAFDCQAGTVVDCYDGVGCTDDSCNEGTDTCDNVANDANCSNGLYCDGAEWCDPDFDCQAGTAVDCDDGIGCTDDSCNEVTDSCDNIASDSYCPDNGLFCDGTEYCDPVSDCSSTGDPCGSGETCNESTDTCDVSCQPRWGPCTQNSDCCSGRCFTFWGVCW
jgi:subtilisin family serine protease